MRERNCGISRRSSAARRSRVQFHVPVRLIQEVLPDVGEVPSLQAMERMPARPDRLTLELQAGLGQELVALLYVARQAGADDVLPRRLAAARDRDDVVEGELRG